MLSVFDFIRELNLLGVACRLFAAVLCGGLIGIEREMKRRPAGFRTHILICLGAAITTLTSQYLYLTLHMYTDVARLGAQVIAGIGFIGAGTIVVTKRRNVKGLTTAAGLWTAAIIGLVIGAGYIECGIFATMMVFLAESLLIRIEKKFATSGKELTIYIEYTTSQCIEPIMLFFREKNIQLDDIEISRINENDGSHKYCAILYVKNSKKSYNGEIAKGLLEDSRILTVEEL